MATNELRATKRILVKLVEEALQQYKQNIFELEDDSASESHTDHLFLQLRAVLGDLLADALCILDKQFIHLHTYEGSEIAEIQIKRQYKRSIWLFPHINYCTCKQFKERVLGLQDQIQATSSTAQSIPEDNSNRYTCAHVLALRLAQVVQPTPATFKVETVTKQQFKNLQNRMYCSYLELFKESLN